jgi:hypothetical protein
VPDEKDDKLVRTRPSAGGVDLFRTPEEVEQTESLGEAPVSPAGLAARAVTAATERRRAAFDNWGDALLTFAEGITDAASLGLLHIPGEAADIRRDVNSGPAFAGNMLGFVGGMYGGPVKVVAGIGRKAGEKAAKAVIGEVAEGSRAAIGVQTAGGAAEMAALMGTTSVGHQLTDAILDDKDFSAAAAIHEAGLGAILGGGFSFLSGVFGRAAKRHEIRGQGGIMDPSSDASKSLADHVRGARDAWDQALSVHEQRLGVLKQLEREGMLEGAFPEFMTMREEALKAATKARAQLDALDFEGALNSSPKAWGRWVKAWDGYEASMRQLDDIMHVRAAERAPVVRPGQAAQDPGAPLTENLGIPQEWVGQMDDLMRNPQRAAEYERLYGRKYEPQVREGEMPGGVASPTSELGTPMQRPRGELELPLPANPPLEGPVFDPVLASQTAAPLPGAPLPGRATVSGRGYTVAPGQRTQLPMGARNQGYTATGIVTPEQRAAQALEATSGGFSPAVKAQAPARPGELPPGWGPGTTPVRPVWEMENTAWYGPGEYGAASIVRENAENFARFQDMMRPTPVRGLKAPAVPAEAVAPTTPVIPRPGTPANVEAALRGEMVVPTPVIPRPGMQAGSNQPTPVIPRGEVPTATASPASPASPATPITEVEVRPVRGPRVEAPGAPETPITPVVERTDVRPVDGTTQVSPRERLRRNVEDARKQEGRQAVRRYIDEWQAMSDAAGPRFSPGDYAADRIRSVMQQLQGVTGGRDIAAAATELSKKLRLPEVRSTLGLTLNDIYTLRQLANVAADASKGTVLKGFRNSPMLEWVLRRSAARIAGETGRSAIKAVGGKLLGPVGYFGGAALVYQAVGMFGRVAGAAGRLYQRSVKAADQLLKGKRAIYAARAAAGNRPIAYSDRGPIKDPVERIEELRRVASSPGTLADFVAQASGDLNLVAPEFVASTVAQVQTQLQFLLEMAPPPRYDYLGRPMPPSAGAIRKFLEAENAVFDLETVLNAVAHGTVTKVQVEALRRAHTPVYTRIAAFLMDDPEKLAKLERAKLKTVGMIVGMGFTPDSDPSFVMRQQAAWEPELPPGATLGPSKAQALKIPGAGRPPSETPSSQPTPSQSYGSTGRAPGN